MTKLEQAMRQLQAEARAMTPPSEPNAALLAEFAGVRGPGNPWKAQWLAVAAVVIATIAVSVFRTRAHAPVIPPAAVPAPVVQVAAMQPTAMQPAPSPVASGRKARRKPVPPEPEAPFMQIPYTAPLAPWEHAEVVRADIPLSALIAAGLPLEVSDPGARARADLMIGPDGRTRAVRLISVSDSTSYRTNP